MVVSKYGFNDTPDYDASRVAAQIVSGIGFLGAGIIVYRRHEIRGLTTAAGEKDHSSMFLCRSVARETSARYYGKA